MNQYILILPGSGKRESDIVAQQLHITLTSEVKLPSHGPFGDYLLLGRLLASILVSWINSADCR